MVLRGGAALGAVEAGAIETFRRHGIMPGVLVGAGVGAVNAAFRAFDVEPANIHPRTIRSRCSAASLRALSSGAGLRPPSGSDRRLSPPARTSTTLTVRRLQVEEKVGRRKVHLSSVVTLTSRGDEETYQVVRSAEAEPLDGRISEDSPLGRALLGHVAGDVVRWRSPGGANAALITKVA